MCSSYFEINELNKLRNGDKIDYRSDWGKWYPSVVVNRNKNQLTLKFKIFEENNKKYFEFINIKIKLRVLKLYYNGSNKLHRKIYKIKKVMKK